MVNRSAEIEERIQRLRKEYQGSFEFSEKTISLDPTDQFSEWFQIAENSGIDEPNAMALATVGTDRNPSLRMVLMKGFSSHGFVFYTNYLSHKGKQLAENPRAALLFFWAPLERQVRIEGQVQKLSAKDSKNYFATRPRGSQLGAASSEQSSVISSREIIENKHAELDRRFNQQPIPCPDHWGGYLLVPQMFEFWQGRENRLHDRIRYVSQNGAWKIERLSP